MSGTIQMAEKKTVVLVRGAFADGSRLANKKVRFCWSGTPGESR
jgi:hypothetical protein